MSDIAYKAAEMRKAADGMLNNGIVSRYDDNSQRYGVRELRAQDISAMLRYAAGVVDRANERRGTFAANYGRIDYESDSAIVDEIDYILRGDGGAE